MRFRSILAGVLCAVLCTNTVFAAEPAEEKYVLTYDKAVEMAIKNNSNIATFNENMDLLEKNYGIVRDGLDAAAVMIDLVGPENSYTLEVERAALLSNAITMNTNMQNERYNRQMLELGCEYMVKTYFSNLIIADKGLEMLEKSVLNEQVAYSHSVIKNSLGMISDMELTTVKANLAASKANLEKTKTAVDKAYSAFATTIGLNKPEGYVIDYSVEYKPMELNRSVDSYITSKLSTDPSIKVAEENYELTRKMKSLSAYSTTPYSYLEKEYNENAASRSLGDTKDAFVNNIKATYNDIKALEAERASLEKALEDANNTLKTVELNYELGNVTELTVEQTKLAVLNAEMNLLQNTFNYDIKVFGFNNPSMLATSTQTNSQQKQ